MLMNMNEILAVAKANRFAIPAFNICDYSMLNGIMDLCEKTNSPVIIEIHPDELDHLGPEVIHAVREMAYKASVPVCVHLDHCKDFGKIMTAIQAGYNSVMYDGADLSFEDNIAGTKKIVEAAHPCGVSVEAELGTIGSTDPELIRAGKNEIIYTDPDDAAKFVAESGCDTLAIAIGTCHGIYPEGMIPKLRLDILKEIAAKVDVPLVLHGGSNNPDEEIAEASRSGVNKINISSDIKVAYFNKMREVLQDRGLREPHEIQPPCMEAMKEVAKHKLELLGALGKADLYK